MTDVIPDINYVLNLKANSYLRWDVAYESLDENAQIILYGQSTKANQRFIFMSLDNQLYAIVSANSGKVVYTNGDKFYQASWNGDDSQKWSLTNTSANYFEIKSQKYGKVASYGSGGGEYVDLDYPNAGDNDRLFQLIFDQPANSLSKPSLPVPQNRPSVPTYTSGPYETMPDRSESRVVGASHIPYFMVNDGSRSDNIKLNSSPYYKLLKEVYWEKVFSTVVAPNQQQQYSYTTGVSSEDQKTMSDTLQMTFGLDLGLNFQKATAALSASITRTLNTTISSTNSNSTSTSISSVVSGTAGYVTGYTIYQLVSKYTLYRADGTSVSNPVITRSPNEIVN
ncbi:RICIN domain-containing protein [Bacillus cereus]|uniref:RICIN domain-containing protein n=1 Tax=Bacillus cereus TaxID=1396 RepID=UPI0009AAEED6|nr:RICIN domain-containing protein [Bacillus cereus]PEQ68072.1 toxin [Bacillus cereus]